MSAQIIACGQAHRGIRDIPPGEGPYPGALVTDGEALAVMMPAHADAVRAHWGWGGAEHVVAPRDLALGEADAAAALMPWCTSRLPAYLERRIAAGEPPSAGECVTVAVSLLRGLAEVGADEQTPCGRWWLTDTRRPVFVAESGATAVSAAREVVELLSRARADKRLSRLLSEFSEALERPRSAVRESERWEAAFWECAAPRALRELADTPARDGLWMQQERVGRADAPLLEDSSGLRRRAAAWSAGVDELRERLRGRWRRLVPRGGGRRVPRAVPAALAAAVVLGVGLLWPDGASDAHEEVTWSEEGVVVDDERLAEASEVSKASEAPDVPEVDAVDPVTAFEGLRERYAACSGRADADCEEWAQWDLSRLLGGEVSLIEDYGDIAIVRVERSDSGAATVVLERREQLWLVRDLYDADQPE